ncbi:MAG TPA: AAA family ATPase [Actinophytocola sp.]|uniref:AAA family ATPase n=1 Tax=Actinophytocola sp. TaxID=1872138 RepID=UPI002DDD2899|nr:AAA family ATPase [Actinophytocola sp.]HEV2778834.1 AAA family ATPase [Actinophytocola sp.]
MTLLTSSLPARVVLICGPPCSGKTTLAAELASEGDVVLDFDAIARDLGSPDRWMHAEPFRSRAERRMRELIRRLPGSAPGTAYVIRSVPRPEHRAITAKSIKAEAVYVLDPGQSECRRRAEADGRPVSTLESIAAWYEAYRSWSGDNEPTGRSVKK